MTNVEAFSGDNPVLTNFGKSKDFLLIKGEKKLTVSLFGSRMRGYRADKPITIENPKAVVQVMGCVDKDENAFNLTVAPDKH
jgi:hypothetical protein